MKKKHLLPILALSCCGLASAAEYEYYIVKDGVINENLVQMPYAADAIHDTLIGGEEYDGVKCAAYIHAFQGEGNAATYNDVRFDLSALPASLTAGYILHMEYCIPTAASKTPISIAEYIDLNTKKDAGTLTPEEEVIYNSPVPVIEGSNTIKSFIEGDCYSNKAAFRFAFDPKAAEEWEPKARYGVDSAAAVCSIQGAFDAVNLYPGQWIKKEVFVFKTPASDSMKSFFFRYNAEANSDISKEPVYIKNLKLISLPETSGNNAFPLLNGVTVFADGSRPFYAENFSAVGAAVTSDNTNADAAKTFGGIVPSVKGARPSYPRVWDKPSDISGIYAGEILHAATKTKAATVTISDITIPAYTAEEDKDNAKKLYVSALIKWKWSANGQAAFDEAEMTPAGRPVKVTASLDGGAETELFADSVLASNWVWYTAEIERGDISKESKLTLSFPASTFDYIIDQVLVGTTAKYASSDKVEDDGDYVEKIKGNVNALYPNPAEDMIYSTIDALKLDVISASGAIVASAEGNQINVSALPSGSYIVKIYTEEGVFVQTIIKK